MKKIIPYARQDISEKDIDSVVEVLNSDFLTQGAKVPEFEDIISTHLGVNYAFASNSATSSLHLSCLAAGISKGDLVWTSPITYVASANCALYCGAEVDFVDIDSSTWNISVEILEDKLKKAEKLGRIPKALILVHLAGNPCNLKEIYELSRRYGFLIIEDASHALGSKYFDEPIGSCKFSDLTVFSFHAVKNITTGEGGMILTNNKSFSKKIDLYRSHGVTRDKELLEEKDGGDWYYEQLLLGFNYRMTDIQASLGISQFNSLDSFIDKRNQISKTYFKGFQDVPISLQEVSKNDLSAWHIFIIKLNLKEIKLNRLEVFNLLKQKGIGVNVHYIPVHLQPFYRNLGFKKGDFPNSEKYYESAITLPMFTRLKQEEIEFVIKSVKESVY
tara:strand:- start:7892 stop:9058 length:1167 start_codon:yes stop_codon:yes gene_type:complete